MLCFSFPFFFSSNLYIFLSIIIKIYSSYTYFQLKIQPKKNLISSTVEPLWFETFFFFVLFPVGIRYSTMTFIFGSILGKCLIKIVNGKKFFDEQHRRNCCTKYGFWVPYLCLYLKLYKDFSNLFSFLLFFFFLFLCVVAVRTNKIEWMGKFFKQNFINSFQTFWFLNNKKFIWNAVN